MKTSWGVKQRIAPTNTQYIKRVRSSDKTEKPATFTFGPAGKPVKSAGNMIGNFQTPTGSDIGPTDIGVTEPLGIFDPQGFMTNTASYAPSRRFCTIFMTFR